MAQPIWITVPGDLGVFPSKSEIFIQLKVSLTAPASNPTYVLLNGSLPEGNVVLTSSGAITGMLKDVGTEKTYLFTVRVTDDLGNIRDGTFSIRIAASVGVKLTTEPGVILIVEDSEYVSCPLEFTNPEESNVVLFRVSSGRLPPGLFLDTFGTITGWPSPPTLLDGSPTTKQYEFAITASSAFGNDTQNYSIIVKNKQTAGLGIKREPAILNNKPLTLPLNEDDQYFGYYTLGNTTLPPIETGKYFAFKVIGHDFDRDALTYYFSTLPNGLVGDPVTGWVSGIINITGAASQQFSFSVYVAKSTGVFKKSALETFYLVVREQSSTDVTWNSPTNLGTFNNGTICELVLSASASAPLHYAVTSGNLPPNISLLSTGELSGRFPFQPEKILKRKGEVSTFTFGVSALLNGRIQAGSEKQFTISIVQRFSNPVETLYFRAYPNIAGKKIIQSLLANEQLIPSSYLYRPDDPYFGKASQVRIDHQYGVVATNVLSYLNAIPNNHYRQKYVFDSLKTAIARDSDNNILYEVVYAQLIDPATNAAGESVPMSIAWPHDIGLRYGDWYDSRTDKFTSSNTAFTSFTPGYVKQLTPVSLENMRKEIEQNLTYDYDQTLLPKWMTSQQLDGNTLGFTEAWVICYTKPGKAETVKSYIDNYWNAQLSDIDFEIDKFIVDRSATYNWNTKLATPLWGNLPSAYPAPEAMEQYDDIILFNRETIIPKT